MGRMCGKRRWTPGHRRTHGRYLYRYRSACIVASHLLPIHPLSHPSRLLPPHSGSLHLPSAAPSPLPPAPSPLPPTSSLLAQVDNSPRAWQLSFLIYIHYNNKFIELLDTMFMILRKKNKQISFLHVYHHCLLLWSWFLVCRFGCGGDAYFGAVVNSGVHVLMYSYYLVRTLNVRRREEDIVCVQVLFGPLPMV